MRILIPVPSYIKRSSLLRFFLLAAAAVLISGISGCKEDPSLLGKDILPPEDNMSISIDSSLAINAYTITGKHIVTTANRLHPLGSLNDTVFGFSTAGIIAQYRPENLRAPNVVLSVDSMFLILTINKAFGGDSAIPQTVRVYELTEQLPLDTVYYSDFDVTGRYDTEEVGSATFSPKDSIIKIPLTRQDYLSRFIAMNDTIYEDKNDFVRMFKGFYIKTDEVSQGGSYALIDFQPTGDSRLDMYYNSGGLVSNSYTMYFANDIAKFSVFTHEYNSSPVSTNLDVAGSNDSVLFVEGLAGVSVRLRFPSVDTFLAGRRVGINKAALVIPVERIGLGTNDEKTYPANLMLFKRKENGEYEYPEDYYINRNYFNGTYDGTRKAYVFNIGLYLQSYIGKKIPNSEFVIVSYTSSETPNRVVLRGATGSARRMKLFVTYTQLP